MSTKASASPRDLLVNASAAAQAVTPPAPLGETKAGPFAVGNIGTVEVVERASGTEKHLYAVYKPLNGGRSQRIPLAAVSTLAEALA